MSQAETGIGAFAALFLMGLVALAILDVGQGGDPDSTLLVWFTNHPDLFAGILVFLIVVGAVVNLASDL